MKLRIGSRASDLALAQSELVKAELIARHPALEVEIVHIRTTGDAKQGTPEAGRLDKTAWIHELQEAVASGAVDLAVHSGKDIPAEIHQKTALEPLLKRATPFDAFIGRLRDDGRRAALQELPAGATVGTSSLRRKAFLKRFRPDLVLVEHRGNVPTRLRKFEENPELAGIVLACAGLERLGVSSDRYQPISPDIALPAVTQGTLAGQYARENSRVAELLVTLADPWTRHSFVAERTCAEVLAADCNSAVGIFARQSGSALELTVAVLAPDGSQSLQVSKSADPESAEALGRSVAEQLLSDGAGALLRFSTPRVPSP